MWSSGLGSVTEISTHPFILGGGYVPRHLAGCILSGSLFLVPSSFSYPTCRRNVWAVDVLRRSQVLRGVAAAQLPEHDPFRTLYLTSCAVVGSAAGAWVASASTLATGCVRIASSACRISLADW